MATRFQARRQLPVSKAAIRASGSILNTMTKSLYIADIPMPFHLAGLLVSYGLN